MTFRSRKPMVRKRNYQVYMDPPVMMPSERERMLLLRAATDARLTIEDYEQMLAQGKEPRPFQERAYVTAKEQYPTLLAEMQQKGIPYAWNERLRYYYHKKTQE